MSIGHGLISTKLAMPPLKARMVERTHLLDRLTEGKDRSLIVISGAAGSGKTCLICQWLMRDQLPVTWYSLDQADNHSDLFFRYFLAALCGIDDDLASGCGRWLRQGKKLVAHEVFPHILESLSGLRHHVYLVLDDYHFISTKETHDAFFRFLDHLPSWMHVIITSRHSIPFSVPHFKMRNQAVEISASDIRFTEKETERFFVETIPMQLSRDEAHAVWRHVEGWVGGLQLFGLSAKGREVPEDLSDSLARFNHDAIDYLLDEVISVQSERVRVFLEATALLDRFSLELCEEVTGMPDASDILADVYRNNLFLVPLDSERKWFRYHHLLSVAVREHVARSDPRKLIIIQQKAALWFARKGYLEDAFQHAFASGDLEFAADMLEDYLMEFYDRYEIASFRRWLSMLPDHVFRSRTLLRLLACRFDIESVHLLQVKALLDDINQRRLEAFRRYDGYKRKLCEDQLLVYKAILPFWLEPHKVDPSELEKVLGQISLDKTFLPGMTKVIIGSSYFFRGDMHVAAEKARDATTTVLSSNSLFVTMLWFRLMAGVERWQGYLHNAEAVLEKGFSFLEQKGLVESPLSSILCFEMAWVAYQRNDLHIGLDYVNTAMKYVDQAGFSNEIATGYFLQSLILLGLGKTEEASLSAEKIRTMSTSSGESYSVALAEAFSARLAITLGDLKGAKVWADKRQLNLDEPFCYRFAHECLAVAELAYSQERFQDAILVLRKLHNDCESRNMGDLLLDLDLLFCAALHRIGEHKMAMEVLERVLPLAEKQGYERPFVNRASGLLPVLVDFAKENLKSKTFNATYLKNIIKTCHANENANLMYGHHRERLKGILTTREFEILELLSQGYKYSEVADRCFISLDTVRTHVKHVFEKLEAKNRTQAVGHAVSLGLLHHL